MSAAAPLAASQPPPSPAPARPVRRLQASCLLCGGPHWSADHVRASAPTHDRGSFMAWMRSRRVEAQYTARLRAVARVVAEMVRSFGTAPSAAELLSGALRRYAGTLDPWAHAVAERMVRETDAWSIAAWRRHSETIGRELAREVAADPVGHVVQERLRTQVQLIKSLPEEAADRVQRLALTARLGGARIDDLTRQIAETGQVTVGRARLIARTEVARTATELTRARAERAGSTHYVWRTVRDSDVRSSHRALEGTVHAWDDPPESDPPIRAHPGQIWNCRCWCEPIVS